MSGSPVRAAVGHRTDACDGFGGLRGSESMEGSRRSVGLAEGSRCAGEAATWWVDGRRGRAAAGMVDRAGPVASWAVADDGAQMGDNGSTPVSGYERGVRVDV